MNLKEILAAKQKEKKEEKEEEIELLSFDEDLYLSLSIIFLNTSISYTDWRFLVTSLTSLPYILPVNRIHSKTLMLFLIEKKGYSFARDKAYFIDVHMSASLQDKILPFLE